MNKKNETSNSSKPMAYDALLATGFSWQCRYSQNEKSDKHGRWARLCFYKALLIAWIGRIEHIDHGTFYTIKDFFPSNGNSDPCYVGKETDFEKAKEGVEKRWNELLKACC